MRCKPSKDQLDEWVAKGLIKADDAILVPTKRKSKKKQELLVRLASEEELLQAVKRNEEMIEKAREVKLGKTHVMVIPDWQPARLNELLNSHWTKAGKLKKDNYATIATYAAKYGIPKASGKRKIGLTVMLGYRQRGPDPDAFWKSTLDSCVKCGLLLDDNKEGVELMPVRYERDPEGKRSTIIFLTDILE